MLGYLAAGSDWPIHRLFSDPKIHLARRRAGRRHGIIGLEMQPSRLWVRGEIFGLGLAQVAVCGGLLTVVGLLAGLSGPAAMAAMGFVLSSTAIVMQILGRTRLDSTSAQGQRIVSILLLEDRSSCLSGPGALLAPRTAPNRATRGPLPWIIGAQPPLVAEPVSLLTRRAPSRGHDCRHFCCW